jgi:hypothetical protein
VPLTSAVKPIHIRFLTANSYLVHSTVVTIQGDGIAKQYGCWATVLQKMVSVPLVVGEEI